jgi:long-subunit fatty acid transport protein
MRKIILTMLLTAVPVLISAANPGTPGAFVDIGTARPSSMGGAYTAVADDANSVFYNPAGIVTSQYKDFTFMTMRQKGMIPYNYTSFIYQLNAQRGVGAGLIVSGDTIFDEKTFLFSYAENLDWMLKDLGIKGISLGANLKFQFAGYGTSFDEGGDDRIKGSAWGTGMDFGALWQFNDSLKAGVMFRDAFSWLKWSQQFDSYSEGVPMTTAFGVSYKMTDFIISSEISDINTLHIGMEKNIFTYIDLRAGFTQTLDLESYREYFVGMGIGHFTMGPKGAYSFGIDSAYCFERLDNTLKIQGSFKFK